MKKIITFIIGFMLICTACSTEANNSNMPLNKDIMLEKTNDSVIYYKTADDIKLCIKNMANNKEQIVFSQPFGTLQSFSVIEDQLYFLVENTLYEQKLNNLSEKPNIIATYLSEDNINLKPGNNNLSLSIFKYNNNLYILGSALYVVKNNQICELVEDVTTACIEENKVYYGDSKGNIFVVENGDFSTAKKVLTKEIFGDDKYISLLGGSYAVTNLQLSDNKLYFIASMGFTMPGEIYAYNLANGKLNLESNVKNSTVKAFVKYNGQLYCHGSYKDNQNALFKINNKSESSIIVPYISGFTIIDSDIYYYNNDSKHYEKINVKNNDKTQLF